MCGMLQAGPRRLSNGHKTATSTCHPSLPILFRLQHHTPSPASRNMPACARSSKCAQQCRPIAYAASAAAHVADAGSENQHANVGVDAISSHAREHSQEFPRKGEVSASGSVRDKDAMLSTAVQLYEGVWSNGRVTLLDRIMAEEHEQHDRVWQPGRVGKGRRTMKRGVLAYRAAYPDLRFEVQAAGQCTDGESVFVQWYATGTNTGPVREQPPTGKKVAFGGISRLHFDETGRIDKSFVFRQAPEDEMEYFISSGQRPYDTPQLAASAAQSAPQNPETAQDRH